MERIYIIAAVAVILVLVLAYYFLMGGSKWDEIKNRKSGETDDAWSRRIFGALRMNPGQGSEPAQSNLNYLLAGKNKLSASDAREFAKGAAFWYKDAVVKSGLATAGGVPIGF